MLAVVIDRLAFEHATPDASELHRGLITFFMAEEQAIPGQLFRVATGDQVEQRAATREPIKGCGLTCSDRWRDDSGAQGHQELQALGYRDQ